jgi:hypothetical protein
MVSTSARSKRGTAETLPVDASKRIFSVNRRPDGNVRLRLRTFTGDRVAPPVPRG